MAVAMGNYAPRRAGHGAKRCAKDRDLAALSGRALRFLRVAGFEVRAIDSVADGVIDGLAVRAEAPESSPVFFRVIQKPGRLGPAEVRYLRQLMAGHASSGLLITTCSLTPEARQEARRAGSAAIEVIDGQRIEELISRTPGLSAQPSVLEMLDDETLRRRTVDIFPAGYLTVMAIIQGVALGLLVQQLVGRVFGSAHPAILIGEGAANFLAIVVASYEYLWFTTIMRWTPTFLDTLVPYLLGVAEIVPVLLLSRFNWWWISTVVLFAVGGLAFWHTIWRSSAGMFKAPPTTGSPDNRIRPGYPRLVRLLWKLIGSCAAMTLAGTTIYILMINFRVPDWTHALLPWTVTASATAIVLLSELSLKKFYSDYGLPWRIGGKDHHEKQDTHSKLADVDPTLPEPSSTAPPPATHLEIQVTPEHRSSVP